MLLAPHVDHSVATVPLRQPAAVKAADNEKAVPPVWQVERTQEYETYSNGLRVENLFETSTRPLRTGEWAPAGIVYHTTESHMVEFAEDRNTALKRSGLGLLDYVRRNGAYHFVVDRFGRVFRIVRETDAANHSGWSVWADDERVYVNLNDSFLAVAFEAQNEPKAGETRINAAQLHSGRILTEMLRSKHRIAGANCVTHAQVSVNPRNLRVGYHKDWAEGFPFRAMGLPENYRRPVASVSLFGFEPDGTVEAAGMGAGLLAAEDLIRREAAARRMPPERFRAVLRLRWRETVSALGDAGAN
jgi:hypothetical protein